MTGLPPRAWRTCSERARSAHAECGARAFENDVTQLNVEGDNIGAMVAAAARGLAIFSFRLPARYLSEVVPLDHDGNIASQEYDVASCPPNNHFTSNR